MNRDCHGDLLRPAGRPEVYYRCLLDSTVVRIDGDPAKVNGATCPRCERTIGVRREGAVIERAVRVTTQIEMPSPWEGSWLVIPESPMRLDVR